MKKTTPPAAANGPDMTKEYRKELKKLGQKKKFLVRSLARQANATARAISKIEIAAVREIRALKKATAKLDSGLEKEIAHISKRQAILVGRLS